MKKLTGFFSISILFFITFIYSAYPNHGWQFEDKITVGKEPVAVFNTSAYSINHNIFCLGYDKNFDGKFDAADGDEPPSWWFYNEDSLPRKVRDFEFGYLGFPFRPAIVTAGNVGVTRLFISHLNRIRCFNYETGALIDDTVANFPAAAITGSGNILYLSIREENKDYVLIYDYIQKKALDTIPAYKNVQQTILDGNNLFILCEGNYGNGDSKLIKADVTNNKHTILKTVVIGDAGNHLSTDNNYNKDYITVTLNGSSEIKIFNKNDLNLERTIKIPTSGYNGPRESYSFYGSTFTSSYSGKLYIIGYNTIIDSLELYGKGEGIGGFFAMTSIIKTEGLVCKVITATPFKPNSYEPDSTCTIYSFSDAGVSDEKYFTKATISPNPISENGRLEVTVENSLEQFADVSIFSIHGKETAIFQIPIIDGKIDFNFSVRELGLAQGSYYTRITAGNRFKIMPFSVIN